MQYSLGGVKTGFLTVEDVGSFNPCIVRESTVNGICLVSSRMNWAELDSVLEMSEWLEAAGSVHTRGTYRCSNISFLKK